ncbi:MAG: adenosylcobinamide-GDP ribazoletransferase, partial [Roseburia sp.]|nr:adenosylcobinamide-GDP ribazoletransferase [Roseburia sp.]
GAAVILGAAATYFYYRHRSMKELGGTTGDTAGYFLTLCEGVTAVLLAVCSVTGIL